MSADADDLPLTPPRPAAPEQAGPDQAGPDQAGPDQAGPDQAGPDQAGHPPRAPQGVLSGATVLSSSMTGVEIGTQIMGTFEIVEHIATGGMGEVYRGINVHTREPVAIKIVLAALAHDEKILSLFQKEATVLGRLHHDAIVRYQLFTIDPVIRRACLIMEFVEGRALSDYIADGPVPLVDVRRLLARLAGGLQKAHDLGVVHRDLSPDNVIVTDGDIGHAKLIDFGIAKSTNFGGGTLLDGQFAGKYNYVSPEQLGRFKGVITARSDIYALALVIAAACLGRPLDMGDTPADAVERRMSVPDLDGVYPEVRPLLERMLQPNPDHRPRDMASVVAMLDDPGLLTGPHDVPQQTATPPRARNETVLQPPSLSQPPAFRFTDAPRSAESPAPTASPQSRRPDATVVSQPPLPQSAHPSVQRVDQAAPTVLSLPPEFGDLPQSTGSDSPFGAAPTTSAAPQTPGSQTPSSQTPASQTPSSPRTQPSARQNRSRTMPLLTVLGVLALGGGGAWFSGAFAPGPKGPAPTAESPSASQVAVIPASPETPPASLPRQTAETAPEATRVAPAPAAPIATDGAPPAPPRSTAEGAPQKSEAAERLTEEMLALAESAATVPPRAQSATERAAPPPERVAAAPAPAPPPAPMLPAPAPPAATPDLPPDTALTPQGWLSAYQTPDCTYIRPGEPKQQGFAIEAFGTDVDPFVALDRAFAAAQGFEADIGLRIITPEQCSVLNFLERNASANVVPPVLTLEGDVLRTGEAAPLRGTVGALDGRSAYLLLIDDRGGAYDITSLLKPVSPQEQSFLLAVRAANRTDAPPLRPHMLIAFALDRQVSGIAFTQGDSAESVLAQVRAQIAARDEPVALTVGYFRLEDG